MKKSIRTLVKSEDGFTLIEIAIVIAIMGILASISLPVLTKISESKKIKVSMENHEVIYRALSGYVLRNNKLPFAALPISSGLNFGKSKSFATHGIVPFATLGLSESQAKDGFGNFITYVVHENLCITQRRYSKKDQFVDVNEGGVSDGFQGFCDAGIGRYTLKSSDTVQGDMCVILISHGLGGHGAFTKSGSLKSSTPHGSFEEMNKNAIQSKGKTFQSYPYSSKDDALFRHYVTGVTRDNLMSVYARMPCESHDSK